MAARAPQRTAAGTGADRRRLDCALEWPLELPVVVVVAVVVAPALLIGHRTHTAFD